MCACVHGGIGWLSVLPLPNTSSRSQQCDDHCKRQAWLQGKPWISGPWSLDPALAPGPCLGPWPFGPCPDPWPLALALAPARGPWPVAPSPGLGPCPGSLALGPCPDTCPGPKGPVPPDLLWCTGRSAERLVCIYSYRPADLRPTAGGSGCRPGSREIC